MTNAQVREALKKEIEMPHEELKRAHPTIADLKTEFVSYTEDGVLTLDYPLKPSQRNGYQLLQGGYISAFFDNNYGIFSYIATGGQPMPTVNMTVNFHKSVLEDTQKLRVETHIVSVGKHILSMAGEARNQKGVRIATCQTNMLNVNGVRISI